MSRSKRQVINDDNEHSKCQINFSLRATLCVQSFSKLVIILKYIHEAATSCNRMAIGCW